MKTYSFETRSHLSPETLYRAMTDIARWKEWDDEIEWTKIEAAPVEGAQFLLKPKGGPKVKIRIKHAIPGREFTDVSPLPLGAIQVEHHFSRKGTETAFKTVLKVTGLLGFLWDRLIVRKMAAGHEAQMKAFLAYAERYA